MRKLVCESELTHEFESWGWDTFYVISTPHLFAALWSLPGVCQAGQDLLGQAKHCPGDPAVPGTAWPIPHTPAEQCNYMFRWNNGIQNEWMPKQILPVFSNAGAKSVFPYLCWLDTYKVTI